VIADVDDSNAEREASVLTAAGHQLEQYTLISQMRIRSFGLRRGYVSLRRALGLGKQRRPAEPSTAVGRHCGGMGSHQQG